MLEDQLAKRNEMAKDIEALENVDRRLGVVFASSGIRQWSSVPKEIVEPHRTYTAGTATDWALIRITNPDRMGKNLFPKNEDFGGPSSFENVRGETRFVPEGKEVSELYPVPVHHVKPVVFKKGRNGHTFGKVIGVKHDIRLGDEVFEGTVMQGYPQEKPCLVPGDSGSWGLDKKGRWTGLFFGGAEESNTGYMMEIGDLMEDIEKRTGLRVLYPPPLWDHKMKATRKD